MKNIKDIFRSKTAKVLGAIGIGVGTSAGQTPVIDGWLEASAGVNQGNNTRLYPSVQIGKKLNVSSLIDINKDFPFSKTDLKYNVGNIGNIKISPVLTYLENDFEQDIMTGINVSYGGPRGFGFAEIAGTEDKSVLYTYNSLTGKLGNIALFTQSPTNDFSSTYSEIEATGKDIKGSGISPYARVNLMEGVKPTYQAGVSINPKKTIGFMKGKGHRSKK